MAGEKKCFTFTWKLENCRYNVQKQDEFIKSPSFVVDSIGETKWYLRLYPKGEEYRKYIGFYLYRDTKCKRTAQMDIKYELTFLSKDGLALGRLDTHSYDFSKGHGRGFCKFKKREDVFNTKRSVFLPDGTLTARCRIWKSVGEMAENVRCFARTRIGVEKRSFVWNIKNFSTLVGPKIFIYNMKSETRDKILMSVNLYITGGITSDDIKFQLHLSDETIKYSILRLCLVDASGNRVKCNQEEFFFDNSTYFTDFEFYLTKNQLMEMANSLLPDDTLSLHWECTFLRGVVSEEIEDIQYVRSSSEIKFSETEKMKSNQQMSLINTLNNLKSFYDENFLCDVKLKTRTGIFNAHKVILSASSSVFKAMFSSDMKEKDSDCVNIEDLSDDAVSRMLHYIYTARIENLTWESIRHLYVAAEKYAILNLKSICSSCMKDNLSLSNACEVLLLSDLHADGDLKSSVQSYILRHVNDIVNSDEWKLLMETNAKLAAETMCLQYK